MELGAGVQSAASSLGPTVKQEETPGNAAAAAPLKHDWGTTSSDEHGAVYDCRRCGTTHVVQFIGIDVVTLYPTFLDHVCRPRQEAKSA